MKRVLVIRFSALGDIAMTVPVVASCAQAYPDTVFYVLSVLKARDLFSNLAPNIRFIAADLHGKHRGIAGLMTLYSELRSYSFDYIVDLHGVLRSHFLRILFRLSGIKTGKIDKGRREKKKLTRQKNKQLKPLISGHERYRDVFRRAGFSFAMIDVLRTKPEVENSKFQAGKAKITRIGIAPFAQHRAKMYPLNKMEAVISVLVSKENTEIILFGGGETEKMIAGEWCQKYPGLKNFVGILPLNEELDLMRKTDIILTMDSANMHLASLAGTRVISIWGATHPFAGFHGWNQSYDDIIQQDLSCRPCSVYGNKACFRGDYACMEMIEPEHIINKIEQCVYEDRV